MSGGSKRRDSFENWRKEKDGKTGMAQILGALILGFTFFVSHAFSQDLKKARQQGKVVLYTSMGTNDANAVVKAFERKYPFMRLEPYRTSSEQVLVRLVNEHRAKKYFGDAVTVDGLQSEVLKGKGILDRYVSRETVHFAPQWKDPDGYWTALHQILYVMAYNTKLVSEAEAPKKYEDLLNPRWKKKLGMESEEYYWFGAMLEVMGRDKGLEFMRGLSAQEPNFRKGHSLLTELLSAGEFPVVVALYQHRVDEFIAKGAPVQWTLSRPLIGSSRHNVSLLAGAPRPDAGKLFVDFMLSPDGQQVLRESGRSVGRRGIEPKNPRLRKADVFTLLAPAEKYNQMIKEFRLHFKTE